MTWEHDKSGAMFDFSSLMDNNPYTVLDKDENQGAEYKFSFGSLLKNACSWPSSAIVTDANRECHNLGQFTSAKIDLLDAENPTHGVTIEYSGGSVCPQEEHQSMGVVFRLKCNYGVKATPPKPSGYSTFCKPQFNLSSPAGCPVDFYGGRYGRFFESLGWSLIFCFFGILTIYLAIGFFINLVCKGKACRKAVPHRKFWWELPSLVRDGFRFTYRKIKSIFVKEGGYGSV